MQRHLRGELRASCCCPSERTVKGDWSFGRAWLACELDRDPDDA